MGGYKASNQWKKDNPQPVAILMNYSLEPGPGLLDAGLASLCSYWQRQWLCPALTSCPLGPALRGVRRWQVWRNYLHIVEIDSNLHPHAWAGNWTEMTWGNKDNVTLHSIKSHSCKVVFGFKANMADLRSHDRDCFAIK